MQCPWPEGGGFSGQCRRMATSSSPFPFTLPRSTYFPVRRIDRVKTLRKLRSGAQVQRLVGFLYDDLPHVFDDQGIDPTAYDDRIRFRDPITKYDTLGGYLYYIAMLRKVFNPDFHLHWAKQVGPYEISTRWTVVMKFVPLPWKPELVLTGTTVMGIDPHTMKFCTHVDYWDSIKNNDYFSLEGLMDLVKQLWMYRTPDLETPKYHILKRTPNYEVRKYEPFIVVEASGDKLSGSTGFNSVAGYIFGKNSATHVFTQALNPEISKVSIQIVLPSEKDINSLTAPNEAEIRLRKVEGGIAAVLRFSGKPNQHVVLEKEKILRQNIASDGLRSKEGCLLACYNDPDITWEFLMRNEVLIWLEEFSLE